MNAPDLVRSAVANTFRSKTRTTLTVLAIFVGAFTLTLTSGLGTGINAYIDDTVTAVGAPDVMSVTKNSDSAEDSGPAEYDPDAIASGGFDGATVSALGPADLDTLENVDGVLDVQATKSISADYIRAGDGDRFVLSIGSLVEGQSVQLAAGEELDDTSGELQALIPVSYVEPLGFDTDEAAVGQTVSIAVTAADRSQHVIDATVIGVAEEALASPAGAAVTTNDALTDALFAAQSTGLSSDETERYGQASIWFSPDATADEITALQDRLSDAGFTGTTVADQLGAITAVIDGIVLVLNAFAIIALLAAGFGIVNTLFMSVQERTREIGLMKAMGMGSGRIFSLFSLEAAFIGLLGSALGVVIAILVGGVVSAALSGGLLTSLPGLTLIAFDPVSVASIILVVMGIAFLAGALPAARAARADPVTSLRYE
ncbi:putative ABC transport system permease protein [Diaminobutyricimonas aerilata]|uniref:Putative ABC transport system permease protein n=1 Tax=Diaminobutyricimonas aerilata TaxID=1162967 RepID=A0A2M9CG79_9MICO|nr:ABC transporter permease [Diaminobutyricimonas aerilata]PJJ70870.1 putative ABC transport system permease protein [Diaminobutyricimonas aerilata]